MTGLSGHDERKEHDKKQAPRQDGRGEKMYVDPFEVLHPRFRDYMISIAGLETLHAGMRWTEGPVYFADQRCLIWSDIPNNRMLRWTEDGEAVSIFRPDSNFSNGNTRDRQGRLVTCEHRTRRVTRTEPDGGITVLADSFGGKRLNSPNDVVVRTDGTVWFTDPTYGIMSDYEGGIAESEQSGRYVFRFDPRDGSLKIVVDDMDQPNGLAFSPDESLLYVSDTGYVEHESRARHIRRFRVAEDGALTDAGILANISPHAPDGFRIDMRGNIWTSAGDGVHCITPAGELIGKIRVPERVGNVAFGGPARNRLYICGHTSLYSIFLNTRGAQWP